MTKSPDEIVAEKIAVEFQKRGLIEQSRVGDFICDLAIGNLSADDWKLMAEMSVERMEQTGNARKD